MTESNPSTTSGTTHNRFTRHRLTAGAANAVGVFLGELFALAILMLFLGELTMTNLGTYGVIAAALGLFVGLARLIQTQLTTRGQGSIAAVYLACFAGNFLPILAFLQTAGSVSLGLVAIVIFAVIAALLATGATVGLYAASLFGEDADS